ncbi:MAG TPA: VWA domain-containing protein, partial [Chitinophagaceae bacterium]|nr:VWA domain-containing protein [Chitinophagaceae bacterium]
MIGFHFANFDPNEGGKTKFDQLLNLFMQLLTYTNGDVSEALEWLNQLDREYGMTDNEYGMGDFIDELKDKGYITEGTDKSEIKITPKTEQGIRKKSLEEIFGKMKKSKSGNHQTFKPGMGEEVNPDTRPFQFGDMVEQIDFTESIRNAQINHGVESFTMGEDDLQIRETDFKSQTSTVLMIDISHSMILYGEDRITPAKKVAMALSELITTKYPKDTLDIVVFGNDAWPVEIKDLPYLQVGPYHTNTVAGLELAMDILRRRKNPNKQIFMITDGKPTCLKIGKRYYKNSFGLDRKVTSRCLNLAAQCKKLKIPITTFMIATDPYLQRFVQEFTETNNGKAYFANLDR